MATFFYSGSTIWQEEIFFGVREKIETKLGRTTYGTLPLLIIFFAEIIFLCEGFSQKDGSKEDTRLIMFFTIFIYNFFTQSMRISCYNLM